MREGQSKEIGSADRDVYDMTERGSNDVIEHDKKLVVTLDMACGGSVSGKEEKAIWVPKKLMIGLTKKEKEEDFLVFKGSKLPISRRRSKFMQRNINVVSPGTWLSKLSVQRYEVMEKISKKRSGGLKAMCNMESDSE